MVTHHKIKWMATLLILLLAAADGACGDDEIRHFSAQYALDQASDSEVGSIFSIKMNINNNLNIISDAPSKDYNSLKSEISLDLNTIIEDSYQIDDIFGMKFTIPSSEISADQPSSITSDSPIIPFGSDITGSQGAEYLEWSYPAFSSWENPYDLDESIIEVTTSDPIFHKTYQMLDQIVISGMNF